MNGYDWDAHEVFTDASGKMRARILSWSDGMVHMERWFINNTKRRTRFELPEKYFAESERCGWRKESTK